MKNLPIPGEKIFGYNVRIGAYYPKRIQGKIQWAGHIAIQKITLQGVPKINTPNI